MNCCLCTSSVPNRLPESYLFCVSWPALRRCVLTRILALNSANLRTCAETMGPVVDDGTCGTSEQLRCENLRSFPFWMRCAQPVVTHSSEGIRVWWNGTKRMVDGRAQHRIMERWSLALFIIFFFFFARFFFARVRLEIEFN